MRRSCLGAAAAAALAATPAFAAPSACDVGPARFDVAKVMAAARSPKPGLVLLAAHRGYWRQVPENTIQAVDEAVKRNIETIEIDVRLANDGTLWLLHDFALDRLTSGNGYLSGSNRQYLATVKVRDRHGQVSAIALQSLDEALLYLKQHLNLDGQILRGFVLVIDLKSPPGKDPNKAKVAAYNALKASWARVVAVSGAGDPVLGQAIIFKLKAKEMPDPATLERDLGLSGTNGRYFHVEPVMHSDDADQGNRVIKAYLNKPYVIGFEASAEYVDQPNTSGWIKLLKDQGRTVPGFASWYDYPEGVAFSTGICCLSRNIDPQHVTAERPLDYSGSWDFALQIGANWITADTAPFLNGYLASQRLRDLGQIC